VFVFVDCRPKKERSPKTILVDEDLREILPPAELEEKSTTIEIDW